MTGHAISPALYEALLPSVRVDYDAHDKNCQSLNDFWFGRRGGVSCISDFRDCSGCGHDFYWEGLHWVNFAECEANPSVDEVYLCACCESGSG